MLSRQSTLNRLWAPEPQPEGPCPSHSDPAVLLGVLEAGSLESGEPGQTQGHGGTPSWLHCELAVQDVAEESVGPGTHPQV